MRITPFEFCLAEIVIGAAPVVAFPVKEFHVPFNINWLLFRLDIVVLAAFRLCV